MQMVLDSPILTMTIVSEQDALSIVRRYVDREIDPSFSIVRDSHSNRQTKERGGLRFFICCQEGPLSAIEVDIENGKVIQFSPSEIRVLREKAIILAARKAAVLPTNARGYVLGEYARRQAERYLGDQIGMHFSAVDPVFAIGESAYWQVTIVFKRYTLGPITLGVMDVDAKTGEPIPLTKTQLKQIRERTHAFIEFQPQTAAA